MSNPTQGYGASTPGAGDPYTSTDPNTADDPYATNVPYEPVDPAAPATGGYAATGTTTYTPIETSVDEGPSTKDVAKGEASNVKDTAVDAGKQVASTAKDEAANVAGEAKEQAKGLLSTATSELKSQASTQQSRLAGTVRSYADELQGLAQGNPLQSGPINDLVQQFAGRGSDIAGWLENKEPADVLEELRRFARRRPVVFLAASGLAGVLAGRVARGAVAANTSVDSPKPAQLTDTTYESTTTGYAAPGPAYAESGSTYGAYTDAPAAGYESTSGTEDVSVGYADRGDPIR